VIKYRFSSWRGGFVNIFLSFLMEIIGDKVWSRSPRGLDPAYIQNDGAYLRR
jgi:hypothetical protein